MMDTARTLAETVGVSTACATLGIPRSSLYRTSLPDRGLSPNRKRRTAPERALSTAERVQVQAVLNSARFQDQAPRQVWAALLDEGQYLCSWRTMYRILHACRQLRERRNQLRHPVYAKPELMATGPNQLWSWDISKLKGPMKGIYFYLYVILDVFSRYVVGWMIAERETNALAHTLIQTSCHRQGIAPGQLTVHADRGSPMIGSALTDLFLILGVRRSHSRPHVPDDNPFSEAQFKTMKYHPSFPERFGSIADARAWAERFFQWYNHEHYHTGLALLTPAAVHYGRAQPYQALRQQVLQAAYKAHPERFVRGQPALPQLPQAVWINPPKSETQHLHATLNSAGELSQNA